MPKKSSVKKLEPSLKKIVDDLLKDGGCTLDDIIEELNTHGANISRSSLGRYKKEQDIVMAKLRQSREVSTALVSQLGDAGNDDTSRMIIEIFRSIVFDLLMKAKSGNFDTKDIKALATAIRDMESAAKTSADREIKIRELIEAEQKVKVASAAKSVEKTAKAAGLSKEQLNRIKKDILGISDA